MKKIIIMCLMLVIAAGAFAQSAPSAGLTDSDVTSFSKNYGSIKAELEKLGIDVQDTDSVADAKSAEAKVNSILNKNGISGNNPVAKLKAIAFGYAVEKFEATMAGMAALQQYQNMLSASDYENSDTKARKEVLKKYDVKKKFNVLKDNDGSEWIIIKSSDITFANSTEAEIYAENYVGVSGDWSLCSSCGYLGQHSDGKPFYTWGNDGILCYEKFPIDYDTCAPDRIIEDADVTPALAKKAVLQLYKY